MFVLQSETVFLRYKSEPVFLCYKNEPGIFMLPERAWDFYVTRMSLGFLCYQKEPGIFMLQE